MGSARRGKKLREGRRREGVVRSKLFLGVGYGHVRKSGEGGLAQLGRGDGDVRGHPHLEAWPGLGVISHHWLARWCPQGDIRLYQSLCSGAKSDRGRLPWCRRSANPSQVRPTNGVNHAPMFGFCYRGSQRLLSPPISVTIEVV